VTSGAGAGIQSGPMGPRPLSAKSMCRYETSAGGLIERLQAAKPLKDETTPKVRKGPQSTKAPESAEKKRTEKALRPELHPEMPNPEKHQVSYTDILYDKKDTAAIITLNRPERLNAWRYQTMVDSLAAIEEANADDSISSIIITGAGRGFCAGADMEDAFKSRLDANEQNAKTEPATDKPIAEMDWVGTIRNAKPVIAAVNGPAIGIGVTQILPADVIVASTAAKFGFVFVKVGLVPELGSSHFLTSRIGLGKASELMLSGRIIAADEAHTIGLVDFLVEPDALMTKALELARAFSGNPVAMMRMTKQLLAQNACETDIALVQKREGALLKECYRLPEHKEAVKAFLEKRPPEFARARAQGKRTI